MTLNEYLEQKGIPYHIRCEGVYIDKFMTLERIKEVYGNNEIEVQTEYKNDGFDADYGEVILECDFVEVLR